MKLLILPVVLAATFSDRITLGSAIVFGLLGIFGVVNILAGGKRWKDNLEAEEKRAELLLTDRDRLYERCHDYAIAKNEAEGESHRLKVEVARLEERPDFDQVVEIVRAQSAEAEARTASAVEMLLGRIDERFAANDLLREQRDRQISETLTRVADTLDRISNGGTSG